MGGLLAVLAPDSVALPQLVPDLVVQPDLVALLHLVAWLPWEEDQATLTDEKESLSESISITFLSVGINLTCFRGLPGVFFPLGFLEDSVILITCADLDLGLPTFGFPTITHGV